MKRLLYMTLAFLSLAFSSCIYQDEKPNPILPKFTTLEATDITDNIAVLNGIVGSEDDYDENESDHNRKKIGVMFIVSESPDFDENSIQRVGPSTIEIGKKYSYKVYLESNKTYYYKFVYSTNLNNGNLDKDVDYLWNVVSFKTK